MKKVLFLLLLLPVFAKAQLNTITTVAGGGTGSGSGDGGPATAAVVTTPHCIAFDQLGNLYMSEPAGNRIRRKDAAGIITTVAGLGTATALGDGGPATAASLNAPEGVACDAAGNLYIADRAHYRVRKVNAATGIITTVAGTGVNIFAGSGDGGPATAARFNTPADMRFDKKGNMYIADNSASVVRKVSTSGIITNYAGTPGSPTYSGDGGPATAAEMHDPRFIAIDDTGNLYIAEQLGRRVRRVDTFGYITTIAGTGTLSAYADDIPATGASISPTGIAYLDKAIYISTIDHRIRRIDLTTGMIHTIAGTGVDGYNGDGIAATTAQLDNPASLDVDVCGNLYITDMDNSRIRRIALPVILATPGISITGSSSAAIGGTVTVTATVANAGSSYLVRWMNRGALFATTTVPVVTYTKTAGIDTITARVVSTAIYGCYDSTTSAAHMVAPSLGVDMVRAHDAFLVYPDPAGDVLHISGGSITWVAIYDLLGHMLYSHSQNNSQEANIDVACLSRGIYLLKINDLIARRFLKQ